jgi:myosin protein heavy chain
VEIQNAYEELQAQLDQTRANAQALDADRLRQSQELSRYMEELERSIASSRAQTDQISSLLRQLDEQKIAEEEEQEFLERAQSEIEGLRLELVAKEEEIERLRDFAINSAPSSGAPRSLDDEMLSSMQQSYALDLSTAQSKNRELETAVFEAQAKAHTLQRQVNALEEQLAQVKAASAMVAPGRRSFSPGIPSRPSSRNVDHSDLRRVSLNSRRPSVLVPPPLARSVFDVGLSPDARHKRQVSLSMLKARIDSEMAAASAAASRPPSRALSPVASLSTISEPGPRKISSHRRPQFLDESHVFWCHSCHGDLVDL